MCRRITIRQVEWCSIHGPDHGEVVRIMLDEMFHIAKIGADGGDATGPANCKGTVISSLQAKNQLVAKISDLAYPSMPLIRSFCGRTKRLSIIM